MRATLLCSVLAASYAAPRSPAASAWSTKRKASAASGGAAICTAGAYWKGNVDGPPKITKAGMAKKVVTDGTVAFGHMIFELTKALRKSITIRTPS